MSVDSNPRRTQRADHFASRSIIVLFIKISKRLKTNVEVNRNLVYFKYKLFVIIENVRIELKWSASSLLGGLFKTIKTEYYHLV